MSVPVPDSLPAVAAFSPDLDTTRLELRNLGPEHRDFVLAHFSDPEVSRYLVDDDPVTDQAGADEIVDFYRDPGTRLRNRWVLLERPDFRPIGTIGLHAYDVRRRKIEVGYDLAPPRWGHGLMSEALAAVLDHAFGAIEVHRVEAFVHVDNVRSAALLQRHGFRREGTIRDMYFAGGRWHDHDLFSLLATERDGSGGEAAPAS